MQVKDSHNVIRKSITLQQISKPPNPETKRILVRVQAAIGLSIKDPAQSRILNRTHKTATHCDQSCAQQGASGPHFAQVCTWPPILPRPETGSRSVGRLPPHSRPEPAGPPQLLLASIARAEWYVIHSYIQIHRN